MTPDPAPTFDARATTLGGDRGRELAARPVLDRDRLVDDVVDGWLRDGWDADEDHTDWSALARSAVASCMVPRDPDGHPDPDGAPARLADEDRVTPGGDRGRELARLDEAINAVGLALDEAVAAGVPSGHLRVVLRAAQDQRAHLAAPPETDGRWVPGHSAQHDETPEHTCLASLTPAPPPPVELAAPGQELAEVTEREIGDLYRATWPVSVVTDADVRELAITAEQLREMGVSLVRTADLRALAEAAEVRVHSSEGAKR